MSSSNTTSDIAVAPLAAKQHILQENVIIMGSHDKPELRNLFDFRNISCIVWRLLNEIAQGTEKVAKNLSNNNSEAQRSIVMSGNLARESLKSVSLDDVKNDDLYKLHVKEFVLTLLLNSLHHLHICLFVSLKIGQHFNMIANVTYNTELKEIKTLQELEKLITGWKNGWSNNTIWPILTPKLCFQFSEYLLNNIKTVKENFIAAYLMRANLNFVLVSDTVRDIIVEEIISKVLLNKNKLEVFILFFYHLMCLCTRPTSNHYNWFKLVLSCIPIALFSVDDLKKKLCAVDNNSVNGWAELVNFDLMYSYDSGNPLLGKAAENKLTSIKNRVNEHISETVSKKLEQRLATLAKAAVAEASQAAQPVIGDEDGDNDDDDDDDDDDSTNDCSSDPKELIQNSTKYLAKKIKGENEFVVKIGKVAAAANANGTTEDSTVAATTTTTAASISLKKETLQRELLKEQSRREDKLDEALMRLSTLVKKEHVVENDSAMTELFTEGATILLEHLDSYTICANAEDCRHENLSNVTELPSTILNDFGVTCNTINTFNPFLISTLVTVEPFQFFDTNIHNFTCEMTKLAKEIQNKINGHKSYNNTNTGGKSEALDITMQGVYDTLFKCFGDAADDDDKLFSFFDVAVKAEFNIRTLELQLCNIMKKELDNIGLDPVMIKPNTIQTLKLFTLADVDKKLYPNIITPPTLTAPPLNNSNQPLSPELTAEFNQIQEQLRALYRSVHASYVKNYESTMAIQKVLAKKTAINYSIYNNQIGIELFSILLEKICKLKGFTKQMIPIPIQQMTSQIQMDTSHQMDTESNS